MRFKPGELIMVRDSMIKPWAPRKFAELSPTWEWICFDNYLVKQKFPWKYARKLNSVEKGEK